MTSEDKAPAHADAALEDELDEKHGSKFVNSAGNDVDISRLAGTVEEVGLDGPEARAVLRKIDLYLLPFLMVTYLIQFLDKSCVSYAALWGMEEDAHLTGTEYSWLTTIFYLGYMVSEVPVNVLFQKFNITRICGIFIILWGVVLLCMAAADDFAGLVTARFFLGALESGVSPCFVLLTTMFYRRKEQPFRTGIWFSMNGLAQILGGLIAYGIGHIDNSALPVWKFPFVIFGSATVLWGFIFVLFTPSSPTTAKWLTEEEKAIALIRLAENETGVDDHEWKWYQVREALKDPNLWLLNLTTIANNIVNGGIVAFGPLIVNNFGFTKFETTLLGMPSGACQIIALWLSGYIATKVKGTRHLLMLGGIVVALLGSLLIYCFPSSERMPRLFGYYLFVGFSVTFVQGLNLVQANVAGRTKKTIYASSVFVSYCIGNIIGPQLFFAREAPRYQSGFAAIIVCFAVQILIIACLYINSWRENRRRDKISQGEATDASAIDRVQLGLSDMTDRENLHFRYLL